MQVQTNRARDGLTGAVQSIQLEFAQILKKEGKWVIRPRKLEVVTTYDLEGKRTSQNFHVRAFQDSNEGISKYDSNGNVIEHSQYFEGVFQGKIFCTYDDYGRKIKQEAYSPDGKLCYKTLQRYDERGKVVEAIMYNADDTLYDKHTYVNEYDSTGNLTKVTVRRWINIDGNLIYEPLCEIYYNITYY